MNISDEKMVSLTYDLTVEEELMESATKEHPLTFVFGMGMMLEAFEKNVEGLKKSDKFSFTLTPEEAYGEYIEENVVELPKKIFEIDGVFDEEKISEGQTLPMMDSSGHRMMGSVLEVKTDVIVMDFNHPLAGETLHFKGEIIDVHEPTDEEMALLNDEGGCSCDHCDSDGGHDACGGCC
ncbi:MAG: FKBP-type peptidyl-prolyl cis-trans isomerase [Candidatus Symbiothrix sp.]|jgi:FKBP-type peptidyl-prolyl cis-trans isomerase SlyD|nr:FKBP-type peptidyl-prolyl cis-trans isomerase [Candidatus Symbiothrix sp.]